MKAEEWRALVKMAAEAAQVREIRLRAGKPVLMLTDCGEQMLFDDGVLRKTDGGKKKARRERRIQKIQRIQGEENGQETQGETELYPVIADKMLLKGLMETFSRHSLYAFEEEIGQGFLTIEGGHRVGISGKAVVSGHEIRTIREISGLNIRIAHEVKGCADSVLPWLFRDGEFLDTLIVSPPGAGKTTILRDLIRQISDGGDWFEGRNVSVVDERSEIGACVQGVPQCDLGMRTDILDGCPKAEGLMMMLRSMAPQVLAVDEIGTEKDLEAVRYGMNCGCRILATVHGDSAEGIMRKREISELIREGWFSRMVVLSKRPKPGTVIGIYDETGRLLTSFGEQEPWIERKEVV